MMMTATQPGARERADQEEATRRCGSVSSAPGGHYIGQLTYNVCMTSQTMLLSSFDLIWSLIFSKVIVVYVCFSSFFCKISFVWNFAIASNDGFPKYISLVCLNLLNSLVVSESWQAQVWGWKGPSSVEVFFFKPKPKKEALKDTWKPSRTKEPGAETIHWGGAGVCLGALLVSYRSIISPFQKRIF